MTGKMSALLSWVQQCGLPLTEITKHERKSRPYVANLMRTEKRKGVFMSLIQAFFLSLLQGATEFLPVSSSGHLVLASHWFDDAQRGEDSVAFIILVHFGTLLAVALVFAERILPMLRYVISDGWRNTKKSGLRQAWLRDRYGRMVVAIILAALPTAIIGLVWKDFFEGLGQTPQSVGYALCFTAVLLGLTFLRKNKSSGEEDPYTPFPLWMALVLGIVQGIAITPGISRSGSTIAVAILLGLNRRQAGEFSFLIFIPAIFGVLILKVPEFMSTGLDISLAACVLSVVVSAVSGYIFLKILLRFVQRGQFGYFGIYCLAVGIWAISHFS